MSAERQVGAVSDEALLLEIIQEPLAAAIREINLPLHILLDSRFGELNDNQIEMIEAARASATAADILLRQVSRAIALAGASPRASEETTRVIDLARSALAIAGAHEAGRGVRFDADLSPALPRVRGDRAHLEEALTLLLRDAGAAAGDGEAVQVTAEASGAPFVTVAVSCRGLLPRMSLDRLVATRLLEREGGSVQFAPGATTVRLLR
jgi:signal transduction histidine kinase